MEKALRTAIRPRPLDANKKLPVIRDELIEFDTTDGMFNKLSNFSVGTLKHQLINTKEHISLGKKKVSQKVQKKPKINIPAPESIVVPSFMTSVLPLKASFIKGSFKRGIISNDNQIESRFNIPGFNVLQDDYNKSYEIEETDLVWLKQQNFYMFGREEAKTLKEDIPPERVFEEIVLVFESLTGTEIPILETRAVESILANESIFNLFSKLSISQGTKMPNNLKEELARHVRVIYAWWIKKRQSLNKPILRLYWPRTLPSDQNPELVFRARERERYKLRKKKNNDIEQYYKLFQFLKDSEYIRYMSKLVQKREEIKKLQVLYTAARTTLVNGKLQPAVVKAILNQSTRIEKLEMPSVTSRAQDVLYFSDKMRRQMPSVLASGYKTNSKKSNAYDIAKQNQIDKRNKKQKKLRVKNNEELAANFIKCLEVYTPRNRKHIVSREKRMKLRRAQSFNESLLGQTESKPLVPPQRFLVEGCIEQPSIFEINQNNENYSYIDDFSNLSHQSSVSTLNLRKKKLYLSKTREHFLGKRRRNSSEQLSRKQKWDKHSLEKHMHEPETYISKSIKNNVASILKEPLKDSDVAEIKVTFTNELSSLDCDFHQYHKTPYFRLTL